MISRFRHSLYAAVAISLLLCLTAVSVRGQEAAHRPGDRTVAIQQTEANLGAAVSSALAPRDSAAANANEVAPNEGSASTSAPLSFLAPRILPPPGEHLTPESAPPAPQASPDK